MKIRERLIQRIEQMLAAYGPGGQLQLADVVTLLKAASYDDQGHINSEGLQALIDVGQQYQDCQSLPFSLLLQQFIANLPNEPTLYVPGGGAPAPAQPAPQKPGSKPPSQPASPPPRPAPAPAANHDPRLIGVWEYSTYYSVAGYSRSHSEVRALRTDGHFIESSDSYIDMTERDSCGDETSRTALSNTPEDQRGTWSTAANQLKLVWDNHYYAIYEFSIGRDGMELTPVDPKGGKATYWTRIG